MKKASLKKLLDTLPLIILVVLAMSLLVRAIAGGVYLQWKHILGFLMLPVNVYLFFRHHKIAVLALGLTILTGLFGFIAFNNAITTTSFHISIGSLENIPVFYGQPIFLLWLLIHFVLSIRHYIGIGTKKYWQDMLNQQQRTDTENSL